ncbi:MAG: hypothetical protein A3D67_01080 [Candidatus Lloydbacteria bacterium RIFCSPHIGHO2_02_FULL_51_22]|uniref:Prepilin-type N-terminal cleavage/methylation domain-containing protein n=2 Tax=Candidatus Lloydiibacteriota TaxID=1817910 RepID=A0A1G2DBS8_9BACT|nr:MAG: hypothetical protein A3D67_01080 [Candidatus Lloydbacteria bacterium RIFCSPHIGHO2_02_FULL_51_22]OGZ15058.1 MAG: hypothetical protein A3J08_01800 [Candidatus Lloydbacteria bacterium RIFCSPLOWO2_02_FULL_51_11]
MRAHTIRTNSGMTLLEAVVYVGILATLFTVVVHTVIVSMGAFDRAHATRILASESAQAFSRMLYEIRLAGAVDAEESVFGVSPGTLSLTTQVSSADDTPTTKEFSLSSGVLGLSRGGGAVGALTDGITVTKLIFRQVGVRAVRVEMTVQSSYKKFTDTRKFYGTAILRGAY